MESIEPTIKHCGLNNSILVSYNKLHWSKRKALSDLKKRFIIIFKYRHGPWSANHSKYNYCWEIPGECLIQER